MIVVTGTKRSGTSMWMQLLAAAGLPWIGSEWPYAWERSIGAANPGGFYESLFREGIYHRTNPHPRTGRFLTPEAVRGHLVKVFIPGLVRSDYGYVDKVVATMRPWAAYCDSIDHLNALEDEDLERTHGEEAVQRARARRTDLPPEVVWYRENYALIRDIVTRRYPYRLVAFDNLVDAPEACLAETLRFLGRPSSDAADMSSIVDRGRPRTPRRRDSEWFDPRELAVLDALYDAVRGQEGLPDSLIVDLNRVHSALDRRLADRRRSAPSRGPAPALP